jgi:exopolyphosphatase/guanosine-5'-triphosphate,3'-diphosphate pyrophosphatase
MADMSLAVLDLGSSSFHLMVAQPDGQGGLVRVLDRKRMVRLAASTFTGGFIDDDACHRGLDAVGELLACAHAHGAPQVVAVATSAIREARNGVAFAQRVRHRFGVDVEILSGEDEVRLTYAGAASALNEPARRVAVIDLGGGTLELAAGHGARLLAVHSLPCGVLRLRDEPPAAIVETLLAHAGSPIDSILEHEPSVLVFTSGTARALAALAGARELTRAAIARLATRLRGRDAAGLLALGVDPARTDTVAAGAVMMSALVERAGFTRATVVERALPEGVLLRTLAAETATRARAA